MGLDRGTRALAALACSALALGASSSWAAEPGDWPTYGRDPGGARFSPLKEITAANVGKLKPAWTYRMQSAAPASAPQEQAQRQAEGAVPARRRGPRPASSQATPLVVGGLMYLTTAARTVVALEPETGKEVWSYAPPTAGAPSLRGVEYWPGDGMLAPRIVFGTRDGLLIALDAKTGTPAAGFGKDGVVDMRTAEILNGHTNASLGMTSPPIVFENLVITGSATQESPTLGAAGDVRAWDMRDGKLVWTFHSVPRPGEPGHETWEGESWKGRSGVNVWGFLTVDVARGTVFMPFGAPAWDRYGGDRKGANLFSSSIVAADARTGRYLWHFQLVHHDIWDFDAEAAPTLVEVRQGGRTIPAVAAVSKSGMLFLLERTTGKPIYGVEERPVPASDTPGEAAWPTQPFPVKPPPFARQSFSLNEVAKLTPEHEAWCRKLVVDNGLKLGGPYLPTGHSVPTVQFPGYQGGANWGGGSFDPGLGYYFVNANNFGQIAQNAIGADGTATTAQNPVLGRFQQPETRMPCQEPPWGTLTAIDVNSGQFAWQVPLGVTDGLPPEKSRTGRPNVGGSIATAGGVVFIGASDDARLRAFDSKSGRELWSQRLVAAAHATPITYQGKDGKQYVAVVATGGSFLDSPTTGAALEVFALP
jgi:quinoprotein glucose dehydrogenase